MVMQMRVNALDSFGTRSPSKTNPISAIKAAGGLYGLRKISLAEWSGRPANDDLHVVIRTDTNTVIGQVGNSYECFDNASFFGPVARALVETGAQISRFQIIDNGTRAFMRLAWPDDQNLRIGKPKVGDIVGRRAILSTSHDGKFAGKFILQMLRLACSNGMTVPVAQGIRGFVPCEMALTHTVGGKQQLVNLREMVPTIESYIRRFQIAADLLADTAVSKEQAETIIQRIADPRDTGKSRTTGEPNLALQRVNRITALFYGEQAEADNRTVKDTGWGLYNAAVDFYTHDKGTRGENRHEQRFKSLLPGGAASREIMRSWGIVTDGLGVTKALAGAVSGMN